MYYSILYPWLCDGKGRKRVGNGGVKEVSSFLERHVQEELRILDSCLITGTN